ncbi:MAG: sigma-70 family RNA polymerase sigma factor [Vicinamibacterales bacterium]|nr:sigma-70 family RNA polymerase sigma factor [Vicinamibacterales bacterium]
MDLDHLFRRQSGQIVAALTRALGARHLQLAEDAVQDALVAALQTWPYRGTPDDPAAWLFRVARNRALDRLRHARLVEDKTPAVVAATCVAAAAPPSPALAGEMAPLEDDELGMMFLTCHPALGREARVALTLKIVGGFGVREIGRAFLTDAPTVAQRLVRAKRQLRALDVPFATPSSADVAGRLETVLEAAYLMFNEGYAATEGDRLVREDIAGEALRLVRLLAAHPATATPRTHALYALVCLHAARFPARTRSDGALFLLRDQDRTAWDRRLVAEGMRALDRASSGDEVTAYHLEAGIAACHAVAPSYDATDWPQIAALYDNLYALTRSPIVALNRAIAVSRVEGPGAGIAALAAIERDPALARYHLLPAVLAELWREAGDPARARAYLDAALACAMSGPERRWLEGKRRQDSL